MKKFIPRLIAYGILLLLAGLCLAFSFSTELAIMEGAVLVLLAVVIFVGKKHSLVLDLPWLAMGWILFAVLIPQYSLTVDMLTNGLEVLGYMIENPLDSEILPIGLIAFAALQFFFRKTDKLFFIVLRHVALYMLLRGLQQVLLGRFLSNAHYPLVIVLLSLLYELKTKENGFHQRRIAVCLVSYIVYIMGLLVFGTSRSMFTYVFSMEALWLPITIGAAIMGGLMILEDYNNRVNLKMKPAAFHDLGWVLLFWCVLCLVMHIWPVLLNWTTLVIVPMVLYYCYGMFIRRWMEVTGGKERKAMLVTWSVATVCMLLFSKCLNMESYIAVLMIVLLIAATACWRVTVKKRDNLRVMNCYFGIAAIVMLFAAGTPIALMDTVALAIRLIIMALVSISWCVLCSTTEKLHYCASAIYSNEFEIVLKTERYVPLALLGLTVVTLLVR